MSRRIPLAFALTLTLLSLAGRTAVADDTSSRPRAYVGVTAGALILGGGYGEAAVDGGWRIPGFQGLLWVHGKVFAGGSDTGDRSSDELEGAALGLELRTGGRNARFVFGVDLGAMRLATYNEGELQETTTEVAPSWHLGGELGNRNVMFRFGLGSYARYPIVPLVTVGLAVAF